MEHLLVNLSGATRKETFQERDYIVAPLSLIVPGVLSGSQGPIYYPAEEIDREPQVWNHVPIVVNHPYKDGNPISARDPSVITECGIGYVFNATANGKLIAEGWFDIEKTRKVEPRILDALEANKSIELSTGLFTDSEPAQVNNNTFNGIEFKSIARNFRPDHLAILPDKIGACSIKDGCGVLVNELSHDQKRYQLQDALTALFSQSEPHAYIVDMFDDYFIYAQGDKQFKRTYTATNNNVKLGKEEPVEVKRRVDYISVANESDDTNPSKEPSMATNLDEKQRGEMADFIVTNCDCWKDNKPALMVMTEDRLQAIYNEQKESKEGKKKEAQTPVAPVANESTKPQTDEEWFKSAPIGIQNTIRYAQEIEAREKNELVTKLVANESDEGKRDAALKVYTEMNLNQLRPIAALIPEKKEPVKTVPNYFGSVAPVNNQADEDEELPIMPVVNWSDN